MTRGGQRLMQKIYILNGVLIIRVLTVINPHSNRYLPQFFFKD